MKTLSLFVEEMKAEQRHHRKMMFDRAQFLVRQGAALAAWLAEREPKGPMPPVFGPASDLRDWARIDEWLTRLIADAEREHTK